MNNSRTQGIVDESDTQRLEYDNQLKVELLKMREEMDEKLRAIREETETMVQKRVGHTHDSIFCAVV